MATALPRERDKGNGRSVRLLRGAISVVVLGGFFTVAFGGEVLGHLQRYRFLSLEATAAWSVGPRYRLYREFTFTDDWSQSRRLFLFEASDDPTRSRVVLTDGQYRVLSAVEFDTSGPSFTSALIQTLSPPLLEITCKNEGKSSCLRFQIVRDQIVTWKGVRKVDRSQTQPQAS